MPHTNIDISELRLFDKDGRQVDMEQTTVDGLTYMKAKVYFQPLSVALYSNQNFYLLKKTEYTEKYYGGDTLSTTDIALKNVIGNVSFPNNIQVGQVIRELSITSVPTPHIDSNTNPNGVAWSPVYVAELDSDSSRVKMSRPAVAVGHCDFETVSQKYVFPGENLGDKFMMKWTKRGKDMTMEGWPYLNDEKHVVDEYRLYRNRLYKCVTGYVGGYLGNEGMWKEVSVNKDEYGFFLYDVLTDQQNFPYLEKSVNKSVTYSSDHVDFRYPMEFNVAFNPAEEVVYENVMEIWYKYADDGTEVKIVEISFYGEGVMEDERFSVWLANFGIKFNQYDAMMLKSYDLKEALPDWNVVNEGMKEMFFNKERVFPYIGTYYGLSNMISLLGFHDILHVKEYWINKNPQSAYFDRMLLVDISDMLDDGKIQNASMLEFNRTVKFDDAMRKTGYLALSYEFTRESGEVDADGIPVVEETSDMTPSEVFYKLYRMKEKLKNEFLPTNVVIKDVIGEFVYFQRITPVYWYDQTKIYQNELGESADISTFPTDRFYVQNLQSLYEQNDPSGAPFPIYTFNYGGADPYESTQKYQQHRMPGLMDGIRLYYSEIARHDSSSINNDYYWEFGDDFETPIGCPVILSFDVNKLTIGDLSGKRLSEFVIGTEGFVQSFFTAEEHQRSTGAPYVNQYTLVTVNSSVTFGHIYTHNVSLNGDIHNYTYTSGCTVSVTAAGTSTELSIFDGSTTETYSYSGVITDPITDIAAYLVDIIRTSSQPLTAVDNYDGTFKVFSSTTDPFTVDAVANCTVVGDTADDVAAGIVYAINNEATPVYINATVGTPGTGQYTISAVSYDDAYVNMFESSSSYYTLENIDYLNMYEIEWTVKKIGTGIPYLFTWRGLLKDLHEIPHILPYAGDYDVSARVYDFFGGATMVYKPSLIRVADRRLDIVAFSKFEDKFSYEISNLSDVMLQDFGNSELHDLNVMTRDDATDAEGLRVSLMDWWIYYRSMYAYDSYSNNGVMIWDETSNPPAYVPWVNSTHPLKHQWGVNPKFGLTLSDFSGAKLDDMYYWKVKNMTFNMDFLAGFHMWNVAPFDVIRFGVDGSSSVAKIEYVCPQFVSALVATTTNIDITNVNTIDGVALSLGDIVLVKNQYEQSENGVYTVSVTVPYTNLQLLRSSICDTAYKTSNTFVSVSSGVVNANTAYRPSNYMVAIADAFVDSPASYHSCSDAPSYHVVPFDYYDVLGDIISSEQHQIMGLFSGHVISTGSPEVRMLHMVAREFNKTAYQFLSYHKNTNISLYSVIPVDVIDGSSYTFYEPHWAYSTSLINSLESEYTPVVSPKPPKYFKKEELFLNAPIMDILDGNTNDVDYFVNNDSMDIVDSVQYGHLPTVLDDNYLSLTKTKAFRDGFRIPKYALVFFAVNNLFAKRDFEWILANDVTGEEIVRVAGVPFFTWKFAESSTYRLTVNVLDRSGNRYVHALTNYIGVDSKQEYLRYNDRRNADRKNDIIRQGMMYGMTQTLEMPTPLDPQIGRTDGVEFWSMT